MRVPSSPWLCADFAQKLGGVQDAKSGISSPKLGAFRLSQVHQVEQIFIARNDEPGIGGESEVDVIGVVRVSLKGECLRKVFENRIAAAFFQWLGEILLRDFQRGGASRLHADDWLLCETPPKSRAIRIESLFREWRVQYSVPQVLEGRPRLARPPCTRNQRVMCRLRSI